MSRFVCLAFALAACDSSTTAPLPACSAAMPAGVSAVGGPSGATSCAESAVTAAAAGDLTAAGYTTVGPAIAFGGGGPFQHGIDFVLPYTPSKASGRETEIVVLARRRNAPAHAALVTNIVVESAHDRVHFHAPDVATFQIAVPTAPRAKTRHYTYRALAGVSMGGLGSSMNFWLHPEKYDAIGVMGSDPGPDLTYTLGMIHDFFLSGFCAADSDGVEKIGQLCPLSRPLLADQGERSSSFESFLYEPGEGVGLTLRRKLYLRANRDLARALGNAAYYNPNSLYLPPGVAPSMLGMANQDACGKPMVLKKFYDRRYNPDGSRDVITFCDGNDSDSVGLGKFDPATPAVNPVQIALAVDVNKNGKRDSGEPVIVQGSEPWKDVGTDGLADKDEPGYDPVTNPDPNGDDYHYLWNPTGTENNWRYDEGEPYEDVGIDGVAMSVGGGQATAATQNCYDYGEGNGHFDYAPGQMGWRAHDPRALAEALTAEQLARIDVYYDAGIRDFFNAQVSTNSLLSAILAKGIGVRAFDGFPILNGLAHKNEQQVELTKLDYRQYGRAMYVRYGDPDMPEAAVESTGDGRHVGTALQAVHRAQALMFFVGNRWPGGDRKIAPVDSSMAQKNDVFMASNGRMTPFTTVVPPGYFQPENATKRYPVLYFMHGYGMEPNQLAALSLVAQNAMVDDRVPEERRMQKFILVLVDGKCRPGGEVGDQGPLPTDGDLCEEGTFYAEHPEGTAKGETILSELQAYVDANYRTKAPEDVAVP
jgi:hypothetical protein